MVNRTVRMATIAMTRGRGGGVTYKLCSTKHIVLVPSMDARRLRLRGGGGHIKKLITDHRDSQFNPLTAKFFNLNFHPLEVVSR